MRFLGLTSLLLLLLTLTAQAADENGSLKSFPKYKNWILFGAEGGLIWKNGVSAPEIKNNGLQLGIKVIYSRYSEDLAYDFGFGWRTDSMERNSVSVDTKAFHLEVAGRYRITDQWSAGPVLTGLLGQDVSYSDVGTNSDDRSLSTFVGARVMYEKPAREGRNLLRFGLQAQTDIDLNERQVTWVQGLVEFGWPFAVKKGAPSQSVPAVVEKRPVEKKPINLNLMNAGVRFATGRSELVGKSQVIIVGIAEVLAKYNSEWSSIAILGHTDVLGDYRSNIKLSMARAETVAGVMKNHGIRGSRMTVAGYGPEKPLDSRMTDEAHARNRRVEVQITATNPSPEFISEIKAATRGQK